MSTFRLPEIPGSVPVPLKKPPVTVSSAQEAPLKTVAPAKQESQPEGLPPADMETGTGLGTPFSSWGTDQSNPAHFTASDLLAGGREVWAKGIVLSVILGKPRCKRRGWRQPWY
ncbi:MAG: hypothetical protein K6U80_05430 [Firmicutes bacterium]|nr:hypothetical protein [Bacillota bacterium]